ncbi:ketopantoate reductase PanE/ApbA C terminal-domain-containing protein [Scheffersomyces coipomensis]|uniref:ketopantoate reductase PanE/ApbA C terminal-domain-containing protein n=1 Tax=Scheffersomyces coipomensis TaxID=1788519 RepID=UPI00315C7C3E
MASTTGLPKVLIIGSGGVGAVSALSLHTRNRSEVTMVIRSDYDKVVKEGYTFDSCTYGKITGWRPHNIAKTVPEAQEKFGNFDYIIVTTKNIPDGYSTCEDIIKPAVTPGVSTIILMQNGIGIDGPMKEAFPQNVTLSAVTHIGSTNYHAVIENKGADNVFLGDFDHSFDTCSPKVQKIINDFIHIYKNDNDLNFIRIDDNVKKTRWEKLIYNSVFNTVTAIVNLDVTRCQINNGNIDLFGPAMDEVLAIAKAEGVIIDEAEKKEKFLHIGDGLLYTPSMCVDMRKNQLLEIEIILGNPLKIAKKHNVPTPTLSVIYSLLSMVQFRIKESVGFLKINEDDFKGNSDDLHQIYLDKYIHKQ